MNEDFLKNLCNRLGILMSDYEDIMRMLEEAKRAGFDVSLVLEPRKPARAFEPSSVKRITDGSGGRPPKRINFTSQDEKFLKALKIAVNENDFTK